MSQASLKTSQERGQGRSSRRGRRQGQHTEAGFYSEERIRSMPTLPWDTAQVKTVVAQLNHFAERFFRGELHQPFDQRSKPTADLLLFIPTCFQGPDQTLATEIMAYYMGETPVNPGVVKIFRQNALNASRDGHHQAWLSNLVRAIEIDTLRYVQMRIDGRPVIALRHLETAIQRDLTSVIPVLEAMNSTRRLAIALICQIALQISQGNYDRLPQRLARCIQALGDEFSMQDAAKQLTSGLKNEDEWTPAHDAGTGQTAGAHAAAPRHHQSA
jgi:hypothetical protein